MISKASMEKGSESFSVEFVCAYQCLKLLLFKHRGFVLTACLCMVNPKPKFDFNDGADSTEVLNLKPCK